MDSRLEEIELFVSGLAHDLRNLLFVIDMHAEVLASPMRAAEIDEAGAAIREASRGAMVLATQLMRVRSGRGGAWGAVSVNDLVARLAAMVGASLDARIELFVLLGEDVPTVQGDADALQHAILNLVTNARDALDGQPGTITIETSRSVEQHPARDGVVASIECTKIVVRDTGGGIAAQHAPRLFEPWFTTKGEERGTGLGLTTALSTVRRHGGWMDVASEPGRGATFSIYLPRAR